MAVSIDSPKRLLGFSKLVSARCRIFRSEDSETSSSAMNVKSPRASNSRSISFVVARPGSISYPGGSLIGVDRIRSQDSDAGTEHSEAVEGPHDTRSDQGDTPESKGAVHGSLTVHRFAQVLQAIFGRQTPGLEIRFLLSV
jgi:hypothetical protein